MSTALIDRNGEIPAVREEPTAARTGVWAIRPDLARCWARASPPPGRPGQVAPAGIVMLRALGVLSAVLVSSVLGGLGAWALSA